MTLTTRNRMFRFSSIFAAASFAALVTVFIVQLVTEGTHAFPVGTRFTPFFDGFSLFAYNKYAVLASPALTLLYVAVCNLCILKYFEKTHVPEIIYFGIFLLLTAAEGLRLLTPLFGLWESNPRFFAFLSRALFFCRLSSALILLVSALASYAKIETKTNRSDYIIMAFSLMIACLVPVNVLKMRSTCMAPYAYYDTINVLRIGFAVAAALSFYVAGFRGGIGEYKRASIWLIALTFGLLSLQEGDSVARCAFGFALLVTGSALFLRNIHRYYLWK